MKDIKDCEHSWEQHSPYINDFDVAYRTDKCSLCGKFKDVTLTALWPGKIMSSCSEAYEGNSKGKKEEIQS